MKGTLSNGSQLLGGLSTSKSGLSGATSPQTSLRGDVGTYDPSVEVQTILIGYPKKLADMVDVDLRQLADGAMLVYDSSTQMFVLSPIVDNQNTKIVGGKY
jgi:hypothetical protein